MPNQHHDRHIEYWGEDIRPFFDNLFEVTSEESTTFVQFNGVPELNQGFKLHLAAHLFNYKPLIEAIKPILASYNQPFKVARSFFRLRSLNMGAYHPQQAGKFITIYPDQTIVWEMAEALYQATRAFRSPYIISDKQYKDSQVVFYRYGRFHRGVSLMFDGQPQTDTRDIFNPFPNPNGDPFPEVPRRYIPLEAQLKGTKLLYRSGFGALLQSHDYQTIYREGMALGFMNINRKDAVARLLDEYHNPVAQAYPFVLRPTRLEESPTGLVSIFELPRPMMSLYSVAKHQHLDLDHKYRAFYNLVTVINQLKQDGIFWPSMSQFSIWFDENLDVFLSHTEVFTNRNLLEADPYGIAPNVPKTCFFETDIDKLNCHTHQGILANFARLFKPEIETLPISLRQEIRKCIETAADTPIEEGTASRLIHEALAKWHQPAITDPQTTTKQQAPYRLRWVADYTTVKPTDSPYYVINIASPVTEAITIQNLVLDLIELHTIDHHAVYSRQSPHELMLSLANDAFLNADFGVLITLFFTDAQAFETALDHLTNHLQAYQAPVLPYFYPCKRSPIVHFGRATTSQDSGLVPLPDDAVVTKLVSTYADVGPTQIPNRYKLGTLKTVRARGSIYEVTDTHCPEAQYLLKEARRYYETTSDGIDALMRCRREAEVLRRLAPLPYVNRVIDYWETEFASFLVKDHLPGETLRSMLPKLDAATRSQIFRQVLNQLFELHTNHRAVWLDLKPRNIVISPESRPQPYFIDMESVVFLDDEDEGKRQDEQQQLNSPLRWHTPKYLPRDIKKFKHPERLLALDYYALCATMLHDHHLVNVGLHTQALDLPVLLSAVQPEDRAFGLLKLMHRISTLDIPQWGASWFRDQIEACLLDLHYKTDPK